MTPDESGESPNSPSSLTNKFLLVAFVSVALYNVLELTFMVFSTFKKRSGLYFWSFCIAIWGIPPYSIGFLLKGIGANPNATYAYVTLIVIGWCSTVTGQSVVLYSRLHLVDREKKHLRFILAMIVFNAVTLHSVTTVMVFGSNSPTYSDSFVTPYSIVEKTQVTIFFFQELIISMLYIFATVNLFRGSIIHAKSNRARTLRHLIVVNIVVILLDITILGLEYANLYQLQTAYKGMAYSIKLKLEFNILNELVKLTRSHSDSAAVDLNDYVFDGRHQNSTRRGSSRQSGISPTTLSSRQTESRRATISNQRIEEEDGLEVEPASSAHVPDKSAIRYRREERIWVTQTIDVDLGDARDAEADIPPDQELNQPSNPKDPS
ncbi:unnamed protein product [Clonostachys chloroleuca]|uniref:DUF7703 domain-containing protein n=1 Tax=Clonostachys chloroleuca TaxID=1926264 RepID=A0AA35Q8F3_9HYPO|nr:unnamed protein product [Clonostachys chloroleuca]